MRGSWALYLALGILLVTHSAAQDDDTADHPSDGSSSVSPGDDKDGMDDGDGVESEDEHEEPDEHITDGTASVSPENPEDDRDGQTDGEAEDQSVWEGQEITKDQAKAVHAKIDAHGNKDGKISIAEILVFHKATMVGRSEKDSEEILPDVDTDKNGKVSLKELLEHHFPSGDADSEMSPEEEEDTKRQMKLEEEKFKLADKNNDGFLDKTEFPQAYFAENHDGGLHLVASTDLAEKDKNKDGELAFNEFWEDPEEEGPERDEFNKIDVDQNGKLNVPELKRWKSGEHSTAEAMNTLFEIADQDGDMQLSSTELQDAVPHIANSEAQTPFEEWVQHHEL